jgi:hypothetical protein
MYLMRYMYRINIIINHGMDLHRCQYIQQTILILMERAPNLAPSLVIAIRQAICHVPLTMHPNNSSQLHTG